MVLADATALTRLVDVDAILGEMVGAHEIPPHPDGPDHRRHVQLQHALDFIQQVQRRATFTVELVDEGHDRGRTQAADLHQADGSLLHSLGAVDHHQCRVHGSQGAIGILGEILVAWRIEQIHDAVVEWKLHHRRGDRNAALLFQAHPVRCGMAGGLAAFDGSGELDRAAEQQQLLGERGLAGVGVGDDGKGATACHFLRH